MLKEYRHSHDASTAFAGTAANTPERIGIWAPIERANQFAVRGLTLSLQIHWSVGKKRAWIPSKNARSPKRIACRDDLPDLAVAFAFGKEHREQ